MSKLWKDTKAAVVDAAMAHHRWRWNADKPEAADHPHAELGFSPEQIALYEACEALRLADRRPDRRVPLSMRHKDCKDQS